MPKKNQFTFPPGALGPEPVRIPIVAQGEEWFAVSKPAGVGATSHALYEGAPSLLDALEAAIASGRQQMVKLGIEGVGRVHMLEPEVSGAVLFGKSETAGAKLRDAMGSRQIEFVYDLLAENAHSMEPIRCALPVAVSGAKERPIVSHQHGKKSETMFTPVARYGRYSLWRVRTRDCRPLQVRLHAAESGLWIPGENLLARVRPVYLSEIKRNYRAGREDERPLHGPICLHLRAIDVEGASGTPIRIEAPQPGTFEVLLNRLELHVGGGPIES